MGISDIRGGISDTTIPKLAFRSFSLIELVLIIWAFCQNLDFGFYVLAPCVGLFFVALFLCNIIDSYLDPSYPVIEGENEVLHHPGSGVPVNISCSRHVYTNMPFFVFVDGVLYAKVFRGTDVSIVVPDSEFTVAISREASGHEDGHPFKGRPQDLRITMDEIDGGHVTHITGMNEADHSEAEYRAFIWTCIKFDAEMLIGSIFLTIFLSLKWLWPF